MRTVTKNHSFIKTISIIITCLFFLSTISFAESFNTTDRSTLAEQNMFRDLEKAGRASFGEMQSRVFSAFSGLEENSIDYANTLLSELESRTPSEAFDVRFIDYDAENGVAMVIIDTEIFKVFKENDKFKLVKSDKKSRERYRWCRKTFPLGSFGTSGIRALWAIFLKRVQVFPIMQGVISFFTVKGDSDVNGPVALAGDYRPSTDNIIETAILAALYAKRKPVYCGRIPSPAVAYYGMQTGQCSDMVTASHCPIDQNGMKPNIITGEVLKEDERPILAHAVEMRLIEFMKTLEESMFRFDENGEYKDEADLTEEQKEMLAQARRIYANPIDEARQMYIDRYTTNGFGKMLDGEHIGFWEHTAVGRDMIYEIFTELATLFT